MANDMLNGLPPEYADEIAKAQRRQAIAQALQQQAMAPQDTQMVSGIAVKNSGMSALLRALTGMTAAGQAESAGSDIRGVMGKNAAEERSALGQLAAQPDIKSKIAMAMSSRHPAVRALGQKYMEQQSKMAEAGMKGLFDVGDANTALNVGSTGNLPGAGYKVPEAPAPIWGTQPGVDGAAIPTVINIDPKTKKQTGGFGPGAASKTSVILPTKMGEATIEDSKKEYGSWRERADLAKEAFTASQRAIDALSAGAAPGPLGNFDQAIREFASGFGIDTKNLTATTDLRTALGTTILANARKIAPVTQNDIQYLEKNLGSISTDPQALSNIIAWQQAHSLKTLHDFQSYADAQEATLATQKDPTMRDSLAQLQSGMRVGREAPDSPYGPDIMRLAVAQRLAKQGFDPKRIAGLEKLMKDPAFLSAEFNMGGAFPAVGAANKKDKGWVGNKGKTAKPIAEMTEEEKQAEMAALKKQLGLP